MDESKRQIATILERGEGLLAEVISYPHPFLLKIDGKRIVGVRVECRRVAGGENEPYYELSAFGKDSRHEDAPYNKRIYGPATFSEKSCERAFRDLAWDFKRKYLEQTEQQSPP